jgi:hypothetical protein
MEDAEINFGKEYAEVLTKVLEIRKKRRSLYGDSYQEMESLGHYYHAFNKIKRLKVQLMSELKTGNINSSNYEKIEDNAIDIINYMIFFLIMREKEKTNEY